MNPSKEAIKAAWNAGLHLSNPTQSMGCRLQAAYAIDFAAQQSHLEAIADALKDCCDAHDLNQPPSSQTIANSRTALDAARKAGVIK